MGVKDEIGIIDTTITLVYNKKYMMNTIESAIHNTGEAVRFSAEALITIAIFAGLTWPFWFIPVGMFGEDFGLWDLK